MDIGTPKILRLRDRLLAMGPPSMLPPPGPSLPTPEEEASISRFFPFAELLFMVARMDGKLEDDERAAVLGAFRALTGGKLPRATLAQIEARVDELFYTQGLEERLNAVCSHIALDREDAELAFTLASAIALSDDHLDPKEQDFLGQLASWLGISPRRQRELLQDSHL